MLSRTNIVLSVVLGIVAILTVWSRVDYSRPNYEFLPEMKYTPAWTTYSPNPNFANGQTLQAPVAGTIARGQLPLYFEATPEDAMRAGEELQNPYAVTAAEASPVATTATLVEENEEEPDRGTPNLAEAEAEDRAAAERAEQAARVAAAELRFQQSLLRGSETFRVFCVCCHGPGGAGDGPVPQKGFPPPPSLLTGKSREMKDGQLFHIVTYGQANMPNLAAQLPTNRRWDVINFVRSLQESAPDVAPTAVEEQDSSD